MLVGSLTQVITETTNAAIILSLGFATNCCLSHKLLSFCLAFTFFKHSLIQLCLFSYSYVSEKITTAQDIRNRGQDMIKYVHVKYQKYNCLLLKHEARRYILFI